MLLHVLFVFSMQTMTPEEMLAKTVIAEAGFVSRDHSSMLHIFRKRARNQNVSIVEMAQMYSSFWKPKKNPRRRYKMIMSLNLSGDKPKYWNEKLSWPEHRKHWFRAVELSKRFLESKYVRDRCKRANHFGDDKGDLDRALKHKWEFIDCGQHNLFWRE